MATNTDAFLRRSAREAAADPMFEQFVDAWRRITGETLSRESFDQTNGTVESVLRPGYEQGTQRDRPLVEVLEDARNVIALPEERQIEDQQRGLDERKASLRAWDAFMDGGQTRV